MGEPVVRFSRSTCGSFSPPACPAMLPVGTMGTSPPQAGLVIDVTERWLPAPVEGVSDKALALRRACHSARGRSAVFNCAILLEMIA